LVNVGKLLLSLVTPDANDTNQSAKDILDWFNQQFLPAVGDALKITVKVGVELIAGTLEAIWGTLEDLWYDFLESIGFGRPKQGSNQFTNDLAHQIAVQTKATNEEATVTGGVYAGKYAAYTDDTYLGDLMRTYGASYLANGRNVYDWSAETSELTGAQKDVWSMFVEDITRSAEGLTEEIFDSWFETPESEGNESGVPLEAIESMLSTLTTVVAEMPDQAASAAAAAAAGHLSGAKVEMDGQAVGQIVLPTVSAGLARANRAALKAAAAH
jgi:hypothetical protein